ncbi:MAG: ComEC/Rec2 family competence protein [Candidatus Paceibacterota bacterium]
MSISHFYVATLGFFLGVFVASLFSTPLPTLAWLLLLSVVLALLWKRASDDSSSGAFLFIGLALVFFVLGAGRFVVTAESLATSVFDNRVEQKVIIEGRVDREPDRRANSLHLYVKIENGEIILVTTDRYHEVSYGDVLRVEGKLQKPEAFVTDLGRTFNYPGYLLAKGVKYQISFAEIEVLRRGEGNVIVASLLSFKQKFMSKLEEVIAEPAVGLGEGLLLGVKRALGDDLELAFRKTGIIHIVVLSGYNVMLVVAFVMFVLGYFLRPRARVVAGVVAICLFAILVGFSATVVRASVMASLLLVPTPMVGSI